MKKYEAVKVYVLKKGSTQVFGNWRTETPPIYNHILNAVRDRRKLLVTISRRGDVYLSHKESHFTLSAEQFDTIQILRKNLEVKNPLRPSRAKSKDRRQRRRNEEEESFILAKKSFISMEGI